MKRRSVYILKHASNEDAGTILDYLRRKNISFESIDLYNGAKLPEDLSVVRSVVIMGGPMNVYEEEKFPFLKDEDLFIRRLLDRNIPILGVCLGSQLIAKASRSRVTKAPVEEVGWDTVELTREALKDSLFSRIGENTLKVFQWHGDTFDLPKNATLLAQGQAVKHQAFRLKDNVYGLQFHVEVNRAMLADWFKNRGDLDLLLKEYDQYQPKLEQITGGLYNSFFKRFG